VDDVKGVYHGIRSKSPLLVALQRNHPESLTADDRDRLTKWLTGQNVSRVYDDIDLGDKSPQILIADNCRSCHSQASTDAAAKTVLLDSDDEVMKLSISRDITPNSTGVVMASTHVHATTLAIVGLVIVMLAACTRWARLLVGFLAGLSGIGLAADIAGWWLTRHHADFAYMIMAGGAAFMAGSVLLTLLIMLDLWLPRRSA
jgi:flagellar biosynthesis protein FliQ